MIFNPNDRWGEEFCTFFRPRDASAFTAATPHERLAWHTCPISTNISETLEPVKKEHFTVIPIDKLRRRCRVAFIDYCIDGNNAHVRVPFVRQVY